MWRPILHIAAFTALIVAPPLRVTAQQTSVPDLVGRRVRITGVDGAPALVGVVMTRDPGSIGLSRGGGMIDSVAFERIERVEVSLGWHNATDQGVLIGGGIMGLIGGAFGVQVASDLYESKLQGFLVVGGLGALAGGLVGGVIGSLVGSERWAEVPLPRPDRLGLRLDVHPTGDGSVAVGFSLPVD